MNHLSELQTGLDKPLLLVTTLLRTMRNFLVLGLLLQSALLAMVSRLVVVISLSGTVNLCLLYTAVLVYFIFSCIRHSWCMEQVQIRRYLCPK